MDYSTMKRFNYQPSWVQIEDQVGAFAEAIVAAHTDDARIFAWDLCRVSADAHRADFGPLGAPGNLAFIEADGMLRPGHDVLNEF